MFDRQNTGIQGTDQVITKVKKTAFRHIKTLFARKYLHSPIQHGVSVSAKDLKIIRYTFFFFQCFDIIVNLIIRITIGAMLFSCV